MHESDTNDKRRTTPLEALHTKRAKLESLERADPAAVSEDYKLLREAEQVGHIGSYSRDLRTGAIRWSDETYRIFGHEPGEISPTFDFVASHVHPEDREKFLEANRAVAEEDKPYDVEYRIVRKDGSIRAVHSRASVERDPAGRPVRMFGAIQDITEHKKAEEALTESERKISESLEFNRKILNTSSIGILTYRESGQCTSANEAAAKVGGTTVASLLAQDFHQIQSWKKSGMYEAALEALRTGTEREIETHVATTFGKDVWLHLRFSSFHAGGERQLLVFTQDVTDRKRVEEALRESEMRFRRLFERAPVAYQSLDADGRFVDVNETWFAKMGYSHDEVLGRWFGDFITPDQRELFRERLPCFKVLGQVSGVEFEMLRKDGTTFIASFKGRIGRNEKGDFKQTHCIFIDITERKQAEEALRLANQWMALHVEQTPLAVIEFDLGGRVQAWNPAAVAIFGFSREEAIGQYWHFMVPEPVWAQLDGVWEGLVTRRGGGRSTNTNRTKDGRIIRCEWFNTPLVDSSGQTIGVASLVQDVTEHHRAQEALREREQKYRSLFNNALVGMFRTRLDGSELLDANEKLLDIFGRTREEVLGRPSVVHWADPRERREVLGRLETQGRLTDFECRMLNQRGEVMTCLISLTLYREQGILEGSIRDISDRKRAEERLRVYQRQLRTLASELSLAEERERRRIAVALHDHTCQSLVLARMKIEEQLEAMSAGQAEAFRGICGTLSDTIEGVRDLTFDLSSPTLYRFGLEAALEELLEDKFGAEQDVEYGFSDDHEPKPLTEDVRVLLFQSVREVLNNVLKHAGAHKITLDIRRTDGSIRIAVTDDGVGFDVDAVSSLPARHHGFGLFSIQERLDCIGGTLEIDSRRGVGSRFTLVAPLKMEGHDSGRKHDAGEDSARG